MAYVAKDYKTNSKAPMGQWVCTRTSTLSPFSAIPSATQANTPNFCGQCVSFVTQVCPTIPVNTGMWKKGAKVKGSTTIVAGTAISTFNAAGKYSGHAAIYDSQTKMGVNVIDQWVTPPAKPIHARMLTFGAAGYVNNGDNFFVVD